MGNRYKYKIGDRWMKGHYMMIKTGNRSKYLHRHLMEEKIGRELLSNEYVHHINGDRLNNEIDNLQIVTAGEHNKIHNNVWVPRKMSDETKEKLRIIALARAPMNDETKAKISSSLKGRPSPRKGIIMSNEQKEKIRKSVVKARKEKFWSTKLDYGRRGGH